MCVITVARFQLHDIKERQHFVVVTQFSNFGLKHGHGWRNPREIVLYAVNNFHH